MKNALHKNIYYYKILKNALNKTNVQNNISKLKRPIIVPSNVQMIINTNKTSNVHQNVMINMLIEITIFVIRIVYLKYTIHIKLIKPVLKTKHVKINLRAW